MNFNKSLAVLAAAVSLFATQAQASDQLVNFDASKLAHFIGTGTLLDGGDDVISFGNLAAGVYDFKLTLSGLDIKLTSLDVNGVAGVVVSDGTWLFAHVHGTQSSPFALTLNGTTLDPRAAYSGEMRVTPVPEPETYALMLAGLAAVGAVARRRQKS